MRNLLLPVLMIAITASCTASKSAGNKGPETQSVEVINSAASDKTRQDGLSFETAVIVPEKSELTGPRWEYEWIKKHYSNYRVNGQALVQQNKKPYDIITIELQDGKRLKLYFDISNYFGKF